MRENKREIVKTRKKGKTKIRRFFGKVIGTLATEDVDYYGLLELTPDATLIEIRKAYRKRSLLVHPDRNPDDPKAAVLFHELTVATDILCDPVKRASYDGLYKARQARQRRFAGLDSKRKVMAQDLEERERAFKKQKGEQDDLARSEQNHLFELKEASRRMRLAKEQELQGSLFLNEEEKEDEENERQRRLRRKEQQSKASQQQQHQGRQQAEHPPSEHQAQQTDSAKRDNGGTIELGPLDTTLRIKWSKALQPSIVDSNSLISLIRHLLSAQSSSSPSNLGIDSVVLSPKFVANPTKGKYASGLVAFETLSAAVRLMECWEQGQHEKEWEGVEVSWAAGATPSILSNRGTGTASALFGSKATTTPGVGVGVGVDKNSTGSTAPSFSSAVNKQLPTISDEDQTLARLRAMERAKLIREMEQEDAREEAAA